MVQMNEEKIYIPIIHCNVVISKCHLTTESFFFIEMDINIGNINFLSSNINYQTTIFIIFSKWKKVSNGSNE